ncbi:MAG: chitin binding domain-containing protein, partial [Chitinophagales bacterium]|nr:chitin binding domain-containing protein [Chitinophagales bacterium]
MKGLQCRDFAGDRSNCQRFIRCFHNLRVLFTCGSNTAYVPDLKTCVGKELVTDCSNAENRV